MFDLNHHPVLVVMTIGVAAPLLVEIPKGFRVPTVVIEMVLGIVIGPQVLGLVKVRGCWRGWAVRLASQPYSSWLGWSLTSSMYAVVP